MIATGHRQRRARHHRRDRWAGDHHPNRQRGAARFDAGTFKEFGLGYAGTVYRGQGQSRTEVYALYDHVWAWNARTAYVGLTRHTDRVELYVSRDLAGDELALGQQMARKFSDGASLEWATHAEIIDIQKERDGRSGRGSGDSGQSSPLQGRSTQPRPPRPRPPEERQEMEPLRRCAASTSPIMPVMSTVSRSRNIPPVVTLEKHLKRIRRDTIGVVKNRCSINCARSRGNSGKDISYAEIPSLCDQPIFA
jgi:hypothetical protein